jgi:hypothetical protein
MFSSDRTFLDTVFYLNNTLTQKKKKKHKHLKYNQVSSQEKLEGSQWSHLKPNLLRQQRCCLTELP